MDKLVVTALMPCLNEAETIATCVKKAKACIERMGVPGEVVVADNGSTDGSIELALRHGARVVHQPMKGYGAALMAGIEVARGEIIVMGDSDDSYDWTAFDPLVAKAQEGYDLVMGNRFKGEIKPGAMPFLHKYLGNPVLSFLGRLFFKAPVGDFHCGMRAFRKDAIQRIKLETPGMEFASEMVVKASLHGLRFAEVPLTLWPDGRSRPPHLRTWRDGWRHLKFLLLYSPRWLFLLPGLALLLLGAVGLAMISQQGVLIGNIGLDIHSLAYAGAATVLGAQMALFAVFTKLLGIRSGWLPADPAFERIMQKVSLEAGLIFALILLTLGIVLTVQAVSAWSATEFSALDPRITMRKVVPAVTALTLSGELLLASFFLEVIRVRRPGENPLPPLRISDPAPSN
ncbi:MAG: glycosyltransferase family 2 protein [Burkholderiales bacterium]|nr:glycosyltransferase family 2 protein [Burkholderiales bacterium]